MRVAGLRTSVAASNLVQRHSVPDVGGSCRISGVRFLLAVACLGELCEVQSSSRAALGRRSKKLVLRCSPLLVLLHLLSQPVLHFSLTHVLRYSLTLQGSLRQETHSHASIGRMVLTHGSRRPWPTVGGRKSS